MSRPPARARVSDTIRVGTELALPTIAGGVIKRRPAVLAAAEKLNLDRPAIRLMQRLRGRHGGGLLRLRVPGRSIALVMSPEDVGRVLEDAPEPFAPANYEKRAALTQFQPHGALVSSGGSRSQRRHFNEEVLDTHRPLHQLSPDIVVYVYEAIVAPFTKALVNAAAERTLAPLVDRQHRDQVHAQVVDRGAKPLIGGAVPEEAADGPYGLARTPHHGGVHEGQDQGRDRGRRVGRDGTTGLAFAHEVFLIGPGRLCLVGQIAVARLGLRRRVRGRRLQRVGGPALVERIGLRLVVAELGLGIGADLVFVSISSSESHRL